MTKKAAIITPQHPDRLLGTDKKLLRHLVSRGYTVSVIWSEATKDQNPKVGSDFDYFTCIQGKETRLTGKIQSWMSALSGLQEEERKCITVKARGDKLSFFKFESGANYGSKNGSLDLDNPR